MSNKIHNIVSMIVVIICLISIWLVTNFWIGSEEDYFQIIKNDRAMFTIKKIGINLIVSAVSIFILKGLTIIIKADTSNRNLKLSAILLAAGSILLPLFLV